MLTSDPNDVETFGITIILSKNGFINSSVYLSVEILETPTELVINYILPNETNIYYFSSLPNRTAGNSCLINNLITKVSINYSETADDLVILEIIYIDLIYDQILTEPIITSNKSNEYIILESYKTENGSHIYHLNPLKATTLNLIFSFHQTGYQTQDFKLIMTVLDRNSIINTNLSSTIFSSSNLVGLLIIVVLLVVIFIFVFIITQLSYKKKKMAIDRNLFLDSTYFTCNNQRQPSRLF